MGPIDLTTMSGVSAKLGAIDSLLYIMERSFTAAAAQHPSGELIRLNDIFYLLWEEIASVEEAVNKLEFNNKLNHVLEASARYDKLDQTPNRIIKD